MPAAPLSPRSAHLLGIAGILLIALNLRTAVAALSPLAPIIGDEIPLDAAAIGLLGVVPPVAFALSGLLAPVVAHRIGLERALLLAVGLMIAGHLIRAVAGDYLALLVGTIVVLLGAGFGNILLPPAVKRYAPHRIGLVTAAYATLMSISTATPAAIGVPIAEAVDWRLALGLWAGVALLAAAPWIALVVRPLPGRDPAQPPTEELDLSSDVVEPETARFALLARSRVAWGVTIPFTVSSITAYSVFALLPLILRDVAGADPLAAGALLAVFAILGLPVSLVTPVLVSRLRTPTPILVASALCFAIGFGGLLVAPTLATAVWVGAIGLGQITFPMCLALIGQRSADADTAVTLSGFVQSVGYGIAAVAPLALGGLAAATGDWSAPLVILLVAGVSALAAIPLLSDRRTVDDDMADAAGGRAA